ncbi:MAG: hypothetical protein C5B49_02710 [Bdellovibrio sp.]|nr:MAG: hypothetical protein C5B49_02710 [Bdellovibrio sp.]
MYFPTALALGALHALEPGHAKALTAAYLIGIKGTKRDAFLLGLSVATTHSIVVVGISIMALWIGRETFTQDISHWLQVGSGIIVILLGTWMLIKRIRQTCRTNHHHHHNAPEPVRIRNPIADGVLEIVETEDGERLKFTTSKPMPDLKVRVVINRQDGPEVLELQSISGTQTYFQSSVAPNEPHEFSAELELSATTSREIVFFEMFEAHEHHDHAQMSDDAHARAHAQTLPEYVKRGERPSMAQICAFGAAGGMIPCPASITVMLLALSIGKFASGILAVAGFSIGLAITLVGIGVIVVAGVSRLHLGTGRFHWLSAKAPVVSAALVIVSGIAALLFAH